MHFIDPPTAALPTHDPAPPQAHGHPASDTLHLASDVHRQHLWRPLAAFTALSLLLMGAHADLWAWMASGLSALGLYCVMLAPRRRASGGETSA